MDKISSFVLFRECRIKRFSPLWYSRLLSYDAIFELEVNKSVLCRTTVIGEMDIIFSRGNVPKRCNFPVTSEAKSPVCLDLSETNRVEKGTLGES